MLSPAQAGFTPAEARGVWGAEHKTLSRKCGPPAKQGSEPGLVTCTAFKAAGVRGLPGQVGSIPTRFRQPLLNQAW